MKIRKGFVSNSSSSSFICEVCGAEHSGWDACLSEADMFGCENGHTVCNGHMVGDFDETAALKALIEQKIVNYTERANNETEEARNSMFVRWVEQEKQALANIEDIDARDYDLYCEIPEQYCPVCTMDTINTDDLVAYLKKTGQLDLDGAKKEIQGKFKNYSEYKKFINTK